MEYETAGDPISGLLWTRKTTEKIAHELTSVDISVSPNTVAKLLKQLGYSLRVNQKKIALTGNSTPEKRINRDIQFKLIAAQRHSFEKSGDPIISVDSKKKENIGNFKNNGQAWRNTHRLVNDHDFPSMSNGKAIPYGIYDTVANRGNIYIGTSHDTASFAVDCITTWWLNEGCKNYPKAERFLILSDNGGSNSSRCLSWKWNLSNELCKKIMLPVTVCHYPPGASKWNPIEHRLFSEISKNWAGIPLLSYEVMQKYIRTTKTRSGLNVKAIMMDKEYELKERVISDQISQIRIRHHKIMPKWNYTIKPPKM